MLLLLLLLPAASAGMLTDRLSQVSRRMSAALGVDFTRSASVPDAVLEDGMGGAPKPADPEAVGEGEGQGEHLQA